MFPFIIVSRSATCALKAHEFDINVKVFKWKFELRYQVATQNLDFLERHALKYFGYTV